MTPGDWKLMKRFQASEFSNPGLMGFEFMLWLDALACTMPGVPFVVTSSARTKEHNTKVGGADDSAHVDIPCNAVDLWPGDNEVRYKIVAGAIKAGCKRVGFYPSNGSLHLDRTENQRPAPRVWTVVK